MLAKNVNDDAACLVNRGALGFFASKLAPTRYVSTRDCVQLCEYFIWQFQIGFLCRCHVADADRAHKPLQPSVRISAVSMTLA